MQRCPKPDERWQNKPPHHPNGVKSLAAMQIGQQYLYHRCNLAGSNAPLRLLIGGRSLRWVHTRHRVTYLGQRNGNLRFKPRVGKEFEVELYSLGFSPNPDDKNLWYQHEYLEPID